MKKAPLEIRRRSLGMVEFMVIEGSSTVMRRRCHRTPSTYRIGFMKPRVTLVTLGVDDLERSLRFYRDGLGLSTEGIVGKEFEYGSVVFFDLESGLRLALWPRASIAHDSGLPAGPKSATEFTLAHNVRSKAEVDTVMSEAKKAGAQIVKSAHDTFYGGYAGYFADPDGHLWEVAWNPAWDPKE